jgi:hypothetical protein
LFKSGKLKRACFARIKRRLFISAYWRQAEPAHIDPAAAVELAAELMLDDGEESKRH